METKTNTKHMEEITTNKIMEYLVAMENRLENRLSLVENNMVTKDDLTKGLSSLEKKFDSKFDLLFDAVGNITEQFTIMDYKFIQFKRQVLAS